MKSSFFIYSLILFGLSYLSLAVSGSFLLNLLKKLGFVQFIRKEGPQSHQKKQFTPTAGGLIFIICIPLVFIINYIFSLISKTPLDYKVLGLEALVILFSCLIGFFDDYLKKVKKQNEGLKPKQKLIAQIILSLIVAFALQRTETQFFNLSINLNFILFCILVFFVLAGTMNASNLTDGLDGLAASVMGCSFLGLAVLIYLTTFNISSIFWAMALSGICFGFLHINAYPAKVFMGDTGSFLLGGALASLALINKLEWYLLLIAIIPLWETVSVLLQVLSSKISKKFFNKDWRPFKMSPFHHHLELCGLNEKQIVAYLAVVQAVFCLIAVLLLNKFFQK